MNKAWKSPMRWKTLLGGTVALALAGSCLAQAQQSPAGDNVSAASGAKRLPWEDRAAVVDARIAALKAGLKLTPDQEKNWPAYEAALRNLAKLRVGYSTHIVSDVLNIISPKLLRLSLSDALANYLAPHINRAVF